MNDLTAEQWSALIIATIIVLKSTTTIPPKAA